MSTPAVAGGLNKNMRNLLKRVTRDQGPEFEQTLLFTNTTQISTPTSLRTDRKIKFIDLHMRGRETNSATPGTFRTGPSLLGTPLFSLIQQFTLRGQHLRYGAQTPIVIRGETAAEWMALLLPNWVPQFSVGVNTTVLVRSAALSNTASATNDFDFVLPVPLYPLDVSPSDATFYALHGPDWPGNLYIDLLTGDVTALGITLAQGSTNLTAFGSVSGQASIDILTERPLISKALMASLQPPVTFRVHNFAQPTAAVSTGTSAAGVKLADLTVGKDTARIFVKAGVAQGAVSAGVTAYASLSDGIITRTFFSLDNRQLRFQNPNADSVLQDYMGRTYGRTIPIGYKVIDFISGPGNGPANPKAVFESSQLTAARQFQLNGDVVVAGGQIAEEVQEMILGVPKIVQSGTAAAQ
jgi:hypothetical protein